MSQGLPASVAAHRLGVTAETVKAYCRNGKLLAKKVGPRQQWSIPEAEVLRLRREWKLDETDSQDSVADVE